MTGLVESISLLLDVRVAPTTGVRAEFTIQVSRPTRSRELGAPSATQHRHPQAAEAVAVEEFGSADVSVAVPTLPLSSERDPSC